MYRILVFMGLFVSLSSFTLAETTTVADGTPPPTDVTQYTVKGAQGNRRYEIAIRSDRKDTVFIVDYRDGKDTSFSQTPKHPTDSSSSTRTMYIIA